MKGLAKLKYILFLAKPYWKYGKVYMIISIIISAVLMPLSSVASTLMPKFAIDAVVNGDTTTTILLIIGGFSAVIFAVNLASNLLSLSMQGMASTKIYYSIMLEVNKKAIETDFKYYDDPGFFTQFSYAQQNFANQANIVSSYIPSLIGTLATASAMIAIVASSGSILLLLTLVFVIIQTLLQLPQSKHQAEYSLEVTDISRRTHYVYRSLQMKENAAELRSSGAGAKLISAYSETVDKLVGRYEKYLKKLLKFIIPSSMFESLRSAIILAYIIIFVIDGDMSKIGLYASLSVAAMTLSGQMSSFFTLISSLYSNLMYGEQIAKFFDTKSFIEPPRKDTIPPPDGQYSVEFRNVSFRYQNAAFCIDGFNLKIEPGQRVAIVGENGAGKSTLTKLLLRLYDADSGTVLINGRDIREYDVHTLRRKIGIAYQDVRILAMSLRDNITAYNDASDEEILAAIDRLNLSGVLEKADGDLGTMVSREFTEFGTVLSGGEAQRLAIARLFIGSFGLLLLDEPSSSLDPLAEYKLMQLILDKSNTATTIMIAHRLSTVRDFDIIYHVENGTIIESGTHAELMAARGKYYEMFTRQAENYAGETRTAESLAV